MNLNNKYRLGKLKVYGLILLTVALTVLSLTAQFDFWKGLFGVATAIIASAVFEILRIAALFSSLKWKNHKRLIGIFLYIGIALFCGSVAVTSWYSKIIEIHYQEKELLRMEYQKRIDYIKNAFTEKQNQKIKQIEKDLYWVDSKLANNMNSSYWINRHEQLSQKRTALINELNEFVSDIPSEPELWIEKNIPLLQLNMEPVQHKTSEYNAIERAIVNTWRISVEEAQLYVSMIFVIVIELAIILLACISKEGDRFNHTPITELESKFDFHDIQLFFNRCDEKMVTKGQLPKSSDLAIRLRPIRKEIARYRTNKMILKMFYNYYCRKQN